MKGEKTKQLWANPEYRLRMSNRFKTTNGKSSGTLKNLRKMAVERIGIKGENHYLYKGGKGECIDCHKQLGTYKAVRCKSCSAKGRPVKKEVGYSRVHKFISERLGKATVCSMLDCDGTSTKFEWALIKGKNYERNTENFMPLCKKCHNKYDNIYEKRLTSTRQY